MVAKRFCTLVSVAILAALGLIAIMLGELPGDRPVAATTASFPSDEDIGTASVQPIAAPGLASEPVRLQSQPIRTTPVGELLIDDTTIAAPIMSNYGCDDLEYDHLPHMP